MGKFHTSKGFGRKKANKNKLLENLRKKQSPDGMVDVSLPSTNANISDVGNVNSSCSEHVSSSGENVACTSRENVACTSRENVACGSRENVACSSSSRENVASSSNSACGSSNKNVACAESVSDDDGGSENSACGMVSPCTLSASARKISGWHSVSENNNDSLVSDSSLSNDEVRATFHLESLSSFISQVQCPSCGSAGSLELNVKPRYKSGLYRRYVSSCIVCSHEIPLETEPSSSKDSLSKLTVLACKESGITYEQLSRSYGITNHVGISAKKYSQLAQDLYKDCRLAMPLHFESVNKLVRKTYSVVESREIDAEELLDIAVSFDGTWQKRGRTSHHGVGVVIDVQSGYVLDFEVVSNFCTLCERNEKASDEWKREHAESEKCEKNFDGNAGAMEAEAAVRIWKRSVSLHRMRYVTMLSDGDAKGYNEVSKVQGMYEVNKEECINHVSKRVYNRLTTLKSKCVGSERIHGKGRMTDKMMREFQSYYGNAIRKSARMGSSIEQLRAAILAIVDHSISSDADPRHDNCPYSSDTWCKYNQLALGLIDSLPPNPNPKLPIWIGEKIRPVFVDLSSTKILQSCLRALTQNANESFNSTIWLRCPKVSWSSAFSVYTATSLACLKFNKGAAAVFDLLQGPMEGKQQMEAKRRDRVRLYKSGETVAAKKVTRRYSKKKKGQPSKDKDSYNPGAY